MIATPLQQVASTRAGMCRPQQRVHKEANVAARPALSLALFPNQVLQPLPLVVAQPAQVEIVGMV